MGLLNFIFGKKDKKNMIDKITDVKTHETTFKSIPLGKRFYAYRGGKKRPFKKVSWRESKDLNTGDIFVFDAIYLILAMDFINDDLVFDYDNVESNTEHDITKHDATEQVTYSESSDKTTNSQTEDVLDKSYSSNNDYSSGSSYSSSNDYSSGSDYGGGGCSDCGGFD